MLSERWSIWWSKSEGDDIRNQKWIKWNLWWMETKSDANKKKIRSKHNDESKTNADMSLRHIRIEIRSGW